MITVFNRRTKPIIKKINVVLIALSFVFIVVWSSSFKIKDNFLLVSDEKVEISLITNSNNLLSHLNRRSNTNIDENIISRQYICPKGSFGRFNNKLIETMTGIYFASLTNRIYIPTHKMLRVFDFKNININEEIIVNTEFNKTLMLHCKNHGKFVNPEIFLKRFLNTSKQKQTEVKANFLSRYNSNDFIRMKSVDLFHSLDFIDQKFPILVYKTIGIKPIITNKVKAFLNQNFHHKPFIAIHLRSLEDTCISRMERAKEQNWFPKMLKLKANDYKRHCDITFDKFLKIFSDLLQNQNTTLTTRYLKELSITNKNENNFKIQVFVASDKEKPEIDYTYFNTPIKKVVVGDKNIEFDFKKYEDECEDLCAEIDFETSVHSNLFIGVIASSASRNIAAFRKNREKTLRIGKFFSSILYSTTETTFQF